MPPQTPAAFNSSDISSDEEDNETRPQYGGKSIEALIASALEDRISSKKTVRRMKFGHGAPVYHKSQDLWVARLEAFRKHTLGQNIKDPFTGDDLIRFLDVIITKLRPYQQDLPSPLVRTIKNAIVILLEYGNFNWTRADGFFITPRDSTRIKHWFDKAVKAGKLVRGRQNPRAWIGFQTVSRLIKEYIETGHKYGTRSWDVLISEVTSILLIASTMGRSGDLALSHGYEASTGYYLKWQDIEAKIVGDKPVLSNLSIVIHLHFVKGSKGYKNNATLRHLEPFKNGSHQLVDPCLWLLILAMRTGQTKPSLQNVLKDAIRRPDKLIAWRNPSLPVLCERSKSNTMLKLDSPAPTNQVLISLKKMALQASMTGRVYVHALRNGAARDISHVPPPTLASGGYANDFTRQSIGHSHVTEMHGSTESYSGGHTIATWNVIASHADYADRRRPEFIEQPDNDEESRILANNTSILPPASAAARKISLASYSETEMRTRALSLQLATSGNPSSNPVQTQESHPGQTETRSVSNEHIDPQLINWDNEDVHVEPETLDFLQDCALAGSEDASNCGTMGEDESAEQAEAIEAMAEEILEDATEPVTLTNEDFVFKYASINIVKNDAWYQQYLKLQRHGIPYDPKMLTQYPTDRAALHGKDTPTPFVFICHVTENCIFTTEVASAFAQHVNNCNEDLVTVRQDENEALAAGLGLPCPYEGCSSILANDRTLKKHTKQNHTDLVGWSAKACEHGCNPSKIYDNPRGYNRHQTEKHSDNNRWPVKCGFAGCEDARNFWRLANLRRHLVQNHNIHAEDEDKLRQYLPSTGTSRKIWKKEQPCPTRIASRSSCGIYKFGTITDMRSHLMTKTHGLTESQANDLIKDQAIYDTQESQVRVHKSTKVKRQSLEEYQELVSNQGKKGHSKKARITE